ncbi:N-6 DNA methylase [Acutalibacter muris]|uniref:N-6 DNA methylase n=1 Tax=Acutalibacter muris TaxID=1796620 RepID=UPI002729EA47|nr:N-6 DNA methylase [Acutalibacter muris]
MIKQKYGVVYTPDTLSEFVAELLKRAAGESLIKVILDPASGECALLSAARAAFGEDCAYIGIDVDSNAVNNTKEKFTIIHNDAIMPQNVKKKSSDYWKSKLPKVDAVIANPPWSSEKIYDRAALISAGFSLVSGQYDSYVLFIEQAYNILCEDGLMAFIIPDSLFDAQNENLRKFLAEKTQIKIIARLGEKIFDEVNRATTVIVCKKSTPEDDSVTTCFRLSTDNRKAYLTGNGTLLSFFDKNCHNVMQRRFLCNSGYTFDIDTRSDEEGLLDKITSQSIDWDKVFIFGRGVEISKAGKVVYCPHCNYAQGYKKKQLEAGKKICTNCGIEIAVTNTNVHNVVTQLPDENSVLIYVGENVRRYSVSGESYIRPDIEGINYKNRGLYNPPKLLIRKTGLGIYSAIDYTGSMTSQTVYILKYASPDNATPLEYYLALINSRVVYYYYLKVYGENEWKSHPYLTKQIIFTLPIRPYTGSQLDQEITQIAASLTDHYDHAVDLRLEKLVMKKYGLTEQECQLIAAEMDRLPNLSAVINMKMEV